MQFNKSERACFCVCVIPFVSITYTSMPFAMLIEHSLENIFVNAKSAIRRSKVNISTSCRSLLVLKTYLDLLVCLFYVLWQVDFELYFLFIQCNPLKIF